MARPGMDGPQLPRLRPQVPGAADRPGEVDACGCRDSPPLVVPAVYAEPGAHPEDMARDGASPLDDGAGLWLKAKPGGFSK